ncbi:MAG TPA: hypothetical protein PKB02_17840 [Anaerohalosphaeraceae bacterium]|nr:hypothetical protein [Anaerohalosphaeraceae bacterium]
MSKSIIILTLVTAVISGCRGKEDASIVSAEKTTQEKSLLVMNDPDETNNTEDLPLESRFEIAGIFGCRCAQPYQIIVEQKGRDVKYKVAFVGTTYEKCDVDFKIYQDLWKACCDINLDTLDRSYGVMCKTGDFRGTFNVDIKYKDRMLSKKIGLEYGYIKEEQFKDLIDKIMEMAPSDMMLPQYSIKNIDYSKRPYHSNFEYKKEMLWLNLLQNADSIFCGGITKEGVKFKRTLNQKEFDNFWKECSQLDLVSIRKNIDINTENGNDFSGYIIIEIETEDGNFSKDFPIKKTEDDTKVNRLIELMTEMASDKPQPLTQNHEEEKENASIEL